MIGKKILITAMSATLLLGGAAATLQPTAITWVDGTARVFP